MLIRRRRSNTELARKRPVCGCRSWHNSKVIQTMDQHSIDADNKFGIQKSRYRNAYIMITVSRTFLYSIAIPTEAVKFFNLGSLRFKSACQFVVFSCAVAIDGSLVPYISTLLVAQVLE
jgi:hypothetical protein